MSLADFLSASLFGDLGLVDSLSGVLSSTSLETTDHLDGVSAWPGRDVVGFLNETANLLSVSPLHRDVGILAVLLDDLGSLDNLGSRNSDSDETSVSSDLSILGLDDSPLSDVLESWETLNLSETVVQGKFVSTDDVSLVLTSELVLLDSDDVLNEVTVLSADVDGLLETDSSLGNFLLLSGSNSSELGDSVNEGLSG